MPTTARGIALQPSDSACAGGVELLYAKYCHTVGWPLLPNLEQKYGGVKWIYWMRDLQSAFSYWRRGEVTLREWWRSCRGRKVSAVFSWSDPAPFLSDLPRVLPKITKKAGRTEETSKQRLHAEQCGNEDLSVNGDDHASEWA